MARVIVFSCLFALLASVAVAQQLTPAKTPTWAWVSEPDIHEIVVGGSDGWTIKPYQDITGATVGDVLLFRWSGSHTVHRYKGKNCDRNGSIHLQSTRNILQTFAGFNPPMFFEFGYRLDKPGTYYFADELSNNCEQGMLFQVTVN